MTRDEAMEILRAETRNGCTESLMRDFIEMSEALGMLKLDEPINPEMRAGEIINDHVGSATTADILMNLEMAGLKIVEK